MSINKSTISHLATLARLEITPAQEKHHAAQLTRIIDLIAQMQAINTDNTPPLAHPSDTPLPLRPDRVTETDQRQTYQKIAPYTAQNLYLTPRVID